MRIVTSSRTGGSSLVPTMPPCTRRCPQLLFRIRRRHQTAIAATAAALLVISLFTGAVATSIGVVYGLDGDNIPSPASAAALITAFSIPRVRIVNHDTDAIAAFENTGVRVLIGVTNDEISGIAASQSTADAWVTSYVAPYIKTVNINAIAVGEEVLTSNSNLSSVLLPAMENIHTSLVTQKFDSSVKVSSPLGLGVLALSYPPSSGVFSTSVLGTLQPILDFYNSTGSFFMLNVYPFYSYENSPSTISLDYALFNTGTPIVDSNNNLQYYNLYDAQIDALISAMGKLNYSDLGVMVTETGWPSAGDPSVEPFANFSDAELYNQHLVQRTMNNSGTPLRPGSEIDAYIISLYDEDLRVTPPVSNQHWGLFYANGTFKYDFNFINGSTGVTGSGTGNNGTSPSPSGTPSGTPSTSSEHVWCVAKTGATNASLQQGIDWACGPGLADCSPVDLGGACYFPDTTQSHASYVFNIHYHFFQTDPRSCVFGGDAVLTNVDPSYGSCYYPPSSATKALPSTMLYLVVTILVLFLRL